MYTIQMVKTNYKKDGKKFVVDTVENSTITEKQYNNIVGVETLKMFRRWGGTETVQRNYTNRGYKVVKLISTSPDKTLKTIREFNHDNN